MSSAERAPSAGQGAERRTTDAARAADDYLKSIYSHTEWQTEPITPSQLADTLGVAPSTVTEMVKKLAARDLVVHEPYRAVRLTAAGARHALQVLRRHRLIETWLVREMGYGWDEVHDEAEVLEHAISDRLLDAIDERLGHPHVDPHGDAIPDADGAIRQAATRPLLECESGYTGEVVRVSDRDPELLRALRDVGIGPGTRVRVDLVGPPAVAVTCDGKPYLISREAAGVVWLSA